MLKGLGYLEYQKYPPRFSVDTAQVIQVIVHETAIGSPRAGSLKNGVSGCVLVHLVGSN